MKISISHRNKLINIVLLTLLMLTFQSVTKTSSMIIASVCLFLMFNISSKIYNKNILNYLLLLAFVIIIVFTLQLIFIRGINVVSSIFVYMNLYIGLICYLFIKDSLSNKNVYYIALMTVLIYYNFTTVYQYVQLGYLRGISSTGSSINYVAALNILAIPYIMYKSLLSIKNNKKIATVFNIIFTGIMLIGVILSGSRSAFAALFLVTILLIFVFLRNKVINRKLLYYIPIFILLVYLFQQIYKSSNYDWLNTGWERAITIFNGGYKDNPRTILRKTAIDTIKNSNFLIGKGDSFLSNVYLSANDYGKTYPHNFILEIMLHSGMLGIVAFASYYTLIIKKIYKELKFYRIELSICIIIIIAAFALAYVQPFLTSGTLFNFIIVGNIFSIVSEVKNNEKVISNRDTI